MNRRDFLWQQKQKSDLKPQNHRDTKGKFQMSCFMPEGVHSQQTSDAASNGGGSHQCGFRDPLEIFLCHALVRKHKHKTDSIDYKKIKKNHLCHGITFLEGSVMKRWICIVLPLLLLCGCGGEETLETVADEWMVPVMAQPREISVRLPENIVMPVLEQGGSRLYMADGYELTIDVWDSGDLSATVRNLSGYEKENLTVIQTRQENADRYDFVWTAMGENGERLGRAVVLDDGNYHYCMSVLRDREEAHIVWQDVFGSFSLL